MEQLTFKTGKAAKVRPSQGMFTDSTGHRHWGYYGAAGLMVRFTDEAGVHYLLQQRSQHVHAPGTWSFPGGAIEYGEAPEDAAVAEFEEEMGPLPQGMKHIETRRKAYGEGAGQWCYYTVVMEAPRMWRPQQGAGVDSWEVAGSGWFTVSEMKSLPLHPGFYDSTEFPQLKRPAEPRVLRAVSGRRVRGHWYKYGMPFILLDLGNDRYAKMLPGSRRPETLQYGSEGSAGRLRADGWRYQARKKAYTGPVGRDA